MIFAGCTLAPHVLCAAKHAGVETSKLDANLVSLENGGLDAKRSATEV
jgi:hypothetical protein